MTQPRSNSKSHSSRLSMQSLWALLFFSAVVLPGCITTRASMEEEQEKRQLDQNVQNLRQGNVQLVDEVSDLKEQLRSLNGRVELTESQHQQLVEKIEIDAEQEDEKWKDLASRYKLLLDSVGPLEDKINEMQQENAELKAEIAAFRKAKQAPSRPKAKKRGNYSQAEVDFDDKKWREAALGYSRYRDLNPKGARYARATFRMGVCFSNLNLKDDAKTFFQELVDRFPENEYGKLASAELKKIK